MPGPIEGAPECLDCIEARCKECKEKNLIIPKEDSKMEESIVIMMNYADFEVRDLVLDEIVNQLKDGFSSGHKAVDDMDYSFECKRASWYDKY